MTSTFKSSLSPSPDNPFFKLRRTIFQISQAALGAQRSAEMLLWVSWCGPCQKASDLRGNSGSLGIVHALAEIENADHRNGKDCCAGFCAQRSWAHLLACWFDLVSMENRKNGKDSCERVWHVGLHMATTGSHRRILFHAVLVWFRWTCIADQGEWSNAGLKANAAKHIHFETRLCVSWKI